MINFTVRDYLSDIIISFYFHDLNHSLITLFIYFIYYMSAQYYTYIEDIILTCDAM